MKGRELHKYAYDLLMSFKEQHPEFTFWFRQRGDEKYNQGYIFQGNENYAFVGLYNRGGGTNMTRSVGIVFTAANGNVPEIKLENAFNEEDDENVLAFYTEMRRLIGGFEKGRNDTNYQKHFKKPIEELQNFLKNQKPSIDALIKDKGLNAFFINENAFAKNLQKIEHYLQENSIPQKKISENFMLEQFSLNTILYGPPGTGKTYNTINKALEITGEDITSKSREEIKQAFDKKVNEGQIVFSTFHQSMSYEDFVEGIKPLKPNPEDAFIKYDVKPGIFKLISEKAKSNYQNSLNNNSSKPSFEEAFERFQQEWELNQNMPFPLKTAGYDYTVTGFTEYSIQFRKASGGTSHTLSINTLQNLYYGQEYNFKAGVGIYYPAILEKLKTYSTIEKSKVQLLNYVLIIDEINRGNVSQIFGELITLIEDDKRLGNAEALELTLPYSKETFSVPQNLYILGTMNTADRSVEALDTALRRRFSFEQMLPKPELLADSKVTEIDLELLLHKINERIEILLSNDHLIGHSFFINCTSLHDVKTVFKNKIIPLLQEYFYGDYGKIGLVLGAGFFKTIEEEQKKNVFSKFGQYDATVFLEKPSYELIDLAGMSDEAFLGAIQQLLTDE